MANGQHSRRLNGRWMWVLVVAPGVVVVIVAPIVELNTWTNLGDFKDLGYIIGLGCLVIFTFYGIWAYERAYRQQPGSIAMRDAIAATVILLYLVLLCWAVFFGSGGGLSAVAQELLKSFTTLTSVVVAFYFGSVTVDQVTSRRRPVSGATEATKDDEGQAT